MLLEILFESNAAPSKAGEEVCHTARAYDPETGLYYYRARYYETNLARFLSEDSHRWFGGGDTFYTYANDNPVNFTDPTGHWPVHGNWCGPNWTGGRHEQYDPLHESIYLPAIDYTDTVCENHDKCYYRCRQDFPCDQSARRSCMRGCNETLLVDIPAEPAKPWNDPVTNEGVDSATSGIFIELGIAVGWIYPDSGPNENSCSCSRR